MPASHLPVEDVGHLGAAQGLIFAAQEHIGQQPVARGPALHQLRLDRLCRRSMEQVHSKHNKSENEPTVQTALLVTQMQMGLIQVVSLIDCDILSVWGHCAEWGQKQGSLGRGSRTTAVALLKPWWGSCSCELPPPGNFLPGNCQGHRYWRPCYNRSPWGANFVSVRVCVPA